MDCRRMAKLAAVVIALLACSASGSEEIYRRDDPWAPIQRNPRAAGAADEAIKKIFRVISAGKSTEKDDEELVKLVKEEIVRTAQSIKTPFGSLDAAAKRAQKLVTELTAAYTTAIYKSRNAEEAKLNFERFQSTVQQIVDFIKTGRVLI